MKILKIEDTRQYEEGPNDKWIPIPGSGIEHNCQRCNKSHEVHVIVQDDNLVFTVGTGCAKKEDMISDKQTKIGSSTAKNIAKLTAQIAHLAPLAQEWDKTYKEEMDKWIANDQKTGNRLVVDRATRDRMNYPHNIYDDESVVLIKSYPNPGYLLEMATKALDKAETKMATIING